MSNKVTGLLEKAYKNDAGYWSINVGDTWYGCYKTDYSQYEGQHVEFESSQKGEYLNVVKNSLKPVANQPAAAAGGGKGVGGAVDNFRQQTITLQSSYKTAAELVGNLIVAGKVDIGTKKADHLDMALGVLDHVALHIYNNCMDPGVFVNGEEEIDPAAPPPSDFNPMEA